MTLEEIAKRQQMETMKYEVAKQIRKLLDDARRDLEGPHLEDNAEEEILDIVTGDA